MQRSTRTAFCAVILALHFNGAWAESNVSRESRAHSADKRSEVNRSLDAQAAVSEIAYESAFKGYRPYREDEVRSWPSANEEVSRIGGWQAYAREAADAHPADSGAASPGETTDHQMK